MSKLRRWSSLAFTVICSATAIAAAAPRAGLAQAANTPVGLWSMTFFDDNTPGMKMTGTETLCFLADGTFFSPSYAGWTGR